MSEKADKLIDAFGESSFDCGEFADEDNLSPQENCEIYRCTYHVYESHKEAITDYITELEAALKEIHDAASPYGGPKGMLAKLSHIVFLASKELNND